MTLDIWVEAHNKLGKIESEHLIEDANWFGKLNVVILFEWGLRSTAVFMSRLVSDMYSP